MEPESRDNLDGAEAIGSSHLSRPVLYRDAQVWKDIEAETGFASYVDYLAFYSDGHPGFASKALKLLHNVRKSREYGSGPNKTVIYDLSIHESSLTRLSLRRYCASGTELMQALRKPPEGVCVQLVLWLDGDSPLNEEMVDTLGLGLRLDLDDFDYREPWSPPPRKSGHRIKSIFGEQTVAAVSQGFMPDVANEVPVVLVASASVARYWDLLGPNFVADYCENPPFCRPSKAILPFEGRIGGKRSLERAGSDYARAVQSFIVQGRDVQPTKQSLLLAALSPLLYAEVYRITNHINRVQARYTDLVFVVSDESGDSSSDESGYSISDDTSDTSFTDESVESRVSQKYLYKQRQEDLDKHRLELRRITEVNEDVLGQFSRYLGSEGPSDLTNQPSYVSIVANLRSLIADARRLDAEVRDFKQIQVGDLALEESRKSIELSNAQIREAKSVKIFTVLAFIYVPLNLATSIFGMNIQQLNGSGQQIWVFFITAVAALLITGGSWLYSSYLATHKAILWYKERAAAKKSLNEERKSGEYGLLLRIAMLIWLGRNGHTLWMWRSGAWAAILTNNETQMNQKPDSWMYEEPNRSACDYVSTFSSPSKPSSQDWSFSIRPFDMPIWSTPLSNFLPSWVPKPRNTEPISAEGSA